MVPQRKKIEKQILLLFWLPFVFLIQQTHVLTSSSFFLDCFFSLLYSTTNTLLIYSLRFFFLFFCSRLCTKTCKSIIITTHRLVQFLFSSSSSSHPNQKVTSLIVQITSAFSSYSLLLQLVYRTVTAA